MLIFHIIAGSLVLLFGYMALFSPKGLRIHKLAGNIFFIAMIILSVTAGYLEIQFDEFPIMGVFSLYFVSTSWATVKRQSGKVGRFEICAFICITLVSITFYKWGWDIVNDVKELTGTLPLAGYFILGTFAAFAAILDLTMIIRGGTSGAHRIARHLWRMCMALLLALMSFLDQDIFPDVILGSGLLWSPLLILLLMMIYSLCRLPFSQWRNKQVL